MWENVKKYKSWTNRSKRSVRERKKTQPNCKNPFCWKSVKNINMLCVLRKKTLLKYVARLLPCLTIYLLRFLVYSSSLQRKPAFLYCSSTIGENKCWFLDCSIIYFCSTYTRHSIHKCGSIETKKFCCVFYEKYWITYLTNIPLSILIKLTSFHLYTFFLYCYLITIFSEELQAYTS